MSSSFVSVFRINGIPILPPVMTPEVRAEVSKYRQKARDIEERLQKTKSSEENSSHQDQVVDLATKPKPSLQLDGQNVVDRRNSFTLETSSLGPIDLPHSTSPAETSEHHQKSPYSEHDSPRPRIIRSNSYTIDSPSPLLMKHLHNQSLDVKSSCSMGEIPISGRMKHVKKLDFEKDGITKIQKKGSTDKPKWETPKKISATKSSTPPKKYKSPYVSISKTSLKASGKSKPKTPKKSEMVNNAKVDSNAIPATTICHQKIQEIQKQHEQRMLKLLKRQEEEQRLLQESFRRQHEEIAKMLLQSVDQIHTSTPVIGSPEDSKTLVMNSEQQQIASSFRKLNINSKDFVQNSDTQSSISNPTSTKTLFVSSNSSKSSIDFNDSDEMYKTCDNNRNNNQWENDDQKFSDIRNYIETMQRTLQDKDLQELSQFDNHEHQNLKQNERIQYNAASLINAYARGYLTRRLFQTEKVQKIVQIIRDTLLFILDMHHEKNAPGRRVRSPADVQLKRTLFHQLTSACNQLHEIFIDTSIQQRMQIIRCDREQIKQRLENRLRPTSTIAQINSRKVSNVSSPALPEQYQTLQVCSLYSVNIEETTAAATDNHQNNNNNHQVYLEEFYNRSPADLNSSTTSNRSSSVSLPHVSDCRTSSARTPTSLSSTVVTHLLSQVKRAISSGAGVKPPSQTTLRPKTATVSRQNPLGPSMLLR
ncbi:centriolar coiled-coil protein of 110 kDa [Sabethes cyaneus]|uniref:centriolar coiled-coil protein of 110 kDa n=1 Tax=Sabethes cyaneus TaxID=53552 RepID=UPI00237E5911|nr:centriolar coiled-coil protein of 110 kDa [Sabethes cyaneus]